jgi:hypothetical protein
MWSCYVSDKKHKSSALLKAFEQGWVFLCHFIMGRGFFYDNSYQHDNITATRMIKFITSWSTHSCNKNAEYELQRNDISKLSITYFHFDRIFNISLIGTPMTGDC